MPVLNRMKQQIEDFLGSRKQPVERMYMRVDGTWRLVFVKDLVRALRELDTSDLVVASGSVEEVFARVIRDLRIMDVSPSSGEIAEAFERAIRSLDASDLVVASGEIDEVFARTIRRLRLVDEIPASGTIGEAVARVLRDLRLVDEVHSSGEISERISCAFTMTAIIEPGTHDVHYVQAASLAGYGSAALVGTINDNVLPPSPRQFAAMRGRAIVYSVPSEGTPVVVRSFSLGAALTDTHVGDDVPFLHPVTDGRTLWIYSDTSRKSFRADPGAPNWRAFDLTSGMEDTARSFTFRILDHAIGDDEVYLQPADAVSDSKHIWVGYGTQMYAFRIQDTASPPLADGSRNFTLASPLRGDSSLACDGTHIWVTLGTSSSAEAYMIGQRSPQRDSTFDVVVSGDLQAASTGRLWGSSGSMFFCQTIGDTVADLRQVRSIATLDRVVASSGIAERFGRPIRGIAIDDIVTASIEITDVPFVPNIRIVRIRQLTSRQVNVDIALDRRAPQDLQWDLKYGFRYDGAVPQLAAFVTAQSDDRNIFVRNEAAIIGSGDMTDSDALIRSSWGNRRWYFSVRASRSSPSGDTMFSPWAPLFEVMLR